MMAGRGGAVRGGGGSEGGYVVGANAAQTRGDVTRKVDWNDSAAQFKQERLPISPLSDTKLGRAASGFSFTLRVVFHLALAI